MDLEWLNQFSDPYLKRPGGKGVLLSGVVLGLVASCQGGRGSNINDAPLFKKLSFGKLQMRDLKRHMSELPVMLKAYDIPYQYQLVELAGQANDLILMETTDLSVDGNFMFTNSFLNAWTYFYRIYPNLKKTDDKEISQDEL